MTWHRHENVEFFGTPIEVSSKQRCVFWSKGSQVIEFPLPDGVVHGVGFDVEGRR